MTVLPMLIFLIAFVLVCYSIRKIIYISHRKHLFDEPSEDRKIHRTNTPNLGGVAIFATIAVVSFFFLPYNSIGHLNYIAAGATILFGLGLTDDLIGVNPSKKVFTQLLVALIITLLADVRLTSFHGMFGWQEMPYAVSIMISVLFILLLINSFNLIDGINCLAGSIGLLSCLSFAWYFLKMQDTGFFFLAVAMSGCLTAFLVFNRTPAKIFMGDTGSLFTGFIVALFAISFIETNKQAPFVSLTPHYDHAPAIVFALLIIPIFDTLRVFSRRLLKGRSPFSADRNHVHHLLLDLGLSHLQATGVLLLVNLTCIALVFLLHGLRTDILFFVLLSLILVLNNILGLLVLERRSERQRTAAPEKISLSVPPSEYPGLKVIRRHQPSIVEEDEAGYGTGLGVGKAVTENIMKTLKTEI